jgi:hypothetical protein
MKRNMFNSIHLLVLVVLFIVQSAIAQIDPELIYSKNAEGTVKILIVEMQGKKLMPLGIGSGFVVTSKGQIFTNRHVIENSVYGPPDKRGNGEVVVQVWTARDKYDLYMAKVDYYSTAFDGAQLSIVSDLNGNPVDKKFRTVVVGDADKLTPGQSLVILGFPGQYGSAYSKDPDLMFKETNTLTMGIVSGYDPVVKLFKTDCKITPGNSGGPVYNKKGEAIGIATALFTSTNLGLVGSVNNMYYVAGKDVVASANVQKPAGDEKIDVVAAERRPPDSHSTKPGRSADLFADSDDNAGQKKPPSKQSPPKQQRKEDSQGGGALDDLQRSKAIEIVGSVFSADTGEPINGVTVGIAVKKGSKAEALCTGKTNRKGWFTLEPKIPPGKYYFVALAEGYQKVVEEVATPDKDWQVRITMNREK